MLPKKHSIKKTDFKIIYKKGKTFYTDNFRITILENRKQFSQFAIVVSKKISPKAVDRNYIRRKIKSYLKENITRIPKGKYYIIQLNKKIKPIKEDIDLVSSHLIKNITK